MVEIRKRFNLISRKLKDTLDIHLGELGDYIDGTYGEHYATDVQTIDKWEAKGTLVTTALDTAEKYLDRYGKKGGRNKKDLWKAIHYILMVIVHDHPASEKG